MRKVKSIFITIAVCITIALICLFGFIMLQNLSAEIFIRLGWEERSELDLFTKGFFMAFFTVAVLPPILEELIFRFGVCKLLKLTKLHDWWVIVISAAIFMVYHLSWSQTVYQFIMGIFFAWIFIKSNNIAWTMLIHFINNAFIVTYTYFAGSSNAPFDINVGSVILSIALAEATTVAVVFLIKKGIPYAK